MSQSPDPQGHVLHLQKNLLGAQQSFSTLMLPQNQWAWFSGYKTDWKQQSEGMDR